MEQKLLSLLLQLPQNRQIPWQIKLLQEMELFLRRKLKIRLNQIRRHQPAPANLRLHRMSRRNPQRNQTRKHKPKHPMDSQQLRQALRPKSQPLKLSQLKKRSKALPRQSHRTSRPLKLRKASKQLGRLKNKELRPLRQDRARKVLDNPNQPLGLHFRHRKMLQQRKSIPVVKPPKAQLLRLNLSKRPRRQKKSKILEPK